MDYEIKHYKTAIANYDYAALRSDELTLKEGDIIDNVRDTQTNGWLKGSLNGIEGVFPSNYVDIIEEQTAVESGAPLPSATADGAFWVRALYDCIFEF
jgi:hypothetical protein